MYDFMTEPEHHLSEQERLEAFRNIAQGLKELERGTVHLRDLNIENLSLELAPLYQRVDELYKQLGIESSAQWLVAQADEISSKIDLLENSKFEDLYNETKQLVDIIKEQDFVNSSDKAFYGFLNNKVNILWGWLQRRKMNRKIIV